MSSIYRQQVKTLKEALYDTIHGHDTLSIEAIAEQLGMTKSYLYRAATLDPDTDGPDATGVRFPLKQLVPLVRVTGDFQVLDLIEYTLGRVAIPIPKHDAVSAGCAQSAAIEAVVKFGDLIKTFQQSISDGSISDQEKQKIETEGRKAIQAIMILTNTKV